MVARPLIGNVLIYTDCVWFKARRFGRAATRVLYDLCYGKEWLEAEEIHFFRPDDMKRYPEKNWAEYARQYGRITRRVFALWLIWMTFANTRNEESGKMEMESFKLVPASE